MNIRKNDKIVVITGKSRGKEAKVLKVFPKEGKILAEGVNMVKKTERAKKAGQKGQVIQKPMPIDISNVKLFCPSCGGVRAGSKSMNGKKIRICKKCGREI